MSDQRYGPTRPTQEDFDREIRIFKEKFDAASYVNPTEESDAIYKHIKLSDYKALLADRERLEAENKDLRERLEEVVGYVASKIEPTSGFVCDVYRLAGMEQPDE